MRLSPGRKYEQGSAAVARETIFTSDPSTVHRVNLIAFPAIARRLKD
jgi:hypothetical protein